MRSRKNRGFTLVELMVSVAIVGILSSVAMPSYQVMTLRTRKAERDVVMTAVNHAAAAILVRDGQFAPTFSGPHNPPGDPTVQRRMLDFTSGTMAPWRKLDLQIEGAVYHSYKFETLTPESGSPEFQVVAEGDLDGNGVHQFKTETFLVSEALSLKPSTTDAPNPLFQPPGDVAF